MSNSKGKYYLVTTTQLIKADSQTKAIATARSPRKGEGKVLSVEQWAKQVPAATAHETLAASVA